MVQKSALIPVNFFILMVALVAMVSGYGMYRLTQPTKPDMPGFFWPNPRTISEFELGATGGTALNLERLQGKWTFLFFGYTYCPDICPTTMSTMASTVELLREEQAADDIQVALVSVDPARDNLEHLEKYVSYFDETFIGATAPLDQLDSLTRQLGIAHYRDPPDEAGNYHVDHSASIILIGPELRYLGLFNTPHSADQIASQFREIKHFLQAQS